MEKGARERRILRQSEITGRTVQPFRNEAAMRDAIAANLEFLEPGMHAHIGYKLGIEYACAEGPGSRRIDILAIDRRGDFVAIECKNKRAGPEALGQLLGYMGWIGANMETLGRPVRGMIVAREASPQLLLAVGVVPGLPIMVFESGRAGEFRRVA